MKKEDSIMRGSDATLKGFKNVRRGKNQLAVLAKNLANREKTVSHKKGDFVTSMQTAIAEAWSKLNSELEQHHADFAVLVNQKYDDKCADAYVLILNRKVYKTKYQVRKLYREMEEITQLVEDTNKLPKDKYFMLTDSEKVEHSKRKWYSSEIPKLSKGKHGSEGKPNISYQIMKHVAAINRICSEAKAINDKFPTEYSEALLEKAMEFSDNPNMPD